MELTNISTIKEIMQRHGFHFSKGLGQNFLINPYVCPRMAEECGANQNTGVLEIGPGFGVLTTELAKTAAKVVTIELDKRLIPVLDETLEDFDNITVIQGDVLKLDLHEILNTHFADMPVVVCANLPYYITSPVIMRLLESRLPVDAVTVMVQWETAERLTAPVGTRNSGAVTASVNYYAQPQLLFKVKSSSFMPAPKVDSAVIRLDILKKPPVSPKDEAFFFKIIKAAFSQRRKTAVNSISSALSINKELVISAITACELPPAVRAERLSLNDFCRISNTLLQQSP